jgi:hypothetical protein
MSATLLLQLAATILVVSAVLAAVAVLTFAWSVAGARVLLVGSLVVTAAGVVLAGLAAAFGGLAAWAFLFACGSCSCSMTAARQLSARPPRWIHRFVIYAGYGATFASMGALGLWLESRAVPGRLAAGVLLGAYLIGSVCIFAAKTLSVRHAAKRGLQNHS